MMMDNSEWFISAFRDIKFGKKPASDSPTAEGNSDDGGGGSGYYPLRIFGAVEKAERKLVACVFLHCDGGTPQWSCLCFPWPREDREREKERRVLCFEPRAL